MPCERDPAMEALLFALNTNKLTYGVAAVLVNLGSRFVIGSLTPAQQTVFSHPVFRRIVFFCIVVMSTRDILLSVGIATAVCLVLEHLLDERSEWCLVRPSSVPSTGLSGQSQQRTGAAVPSSVPAQLNVATSGPMRHLMAAWAPMLTSGPGDADSRVVDAQEGFDASNGAARRQQGWSELL